GRPPEGGCRNAPAPAGNGRARGRPKEEGRTGPGAPAAALQTCGDPRRRRAGIRATRLSLRASSSNGSRSRPFAAFFPATAPRIPFLHCAKSRPPCLFQRVEVPRTKSQVLHVSGRQLMKFPLDGSPVDRALQIV